MTGPDRAELLAAIPRERPDVGPSQDGHGWGTLPPSRLTVHSSIFGGDSYIEWSDMAGPDLYEPDRRRTPDRRRRRTFGLPVLLAACALLFALGFLVRGVVGVG